MFQRITNGFLCTIIILVVCIHLSVINAESKVERIQIPAVTRTQLRVSKSLDPENMQELNVRSNNGGFATIIVKKRDRQMSSLNIPSFTRIYSAGNSENQLKPETVTVSRSNERIENRSENLNQWTPISTELKSYKIAPTTYTYDTSVNDPKSIDIINSFMEHIQNINSNARSFNTSEVEPAIRNDRNPVHIDVSSTHVEQPTNNPQLMRIPEPVQISSEPVYVKENQLNSKRGRSIMSVGVDGIPVIQGVRMPDDEQDKRKIWRNARVINGELIPYENGYVPKKADPIGNGQLVFLKKSTVNKTVDTTQSKGFGPFMAADNFNVGKDYESSGRNLGPFSVEDNLRAAASQTSGSRFNLHHKKELEYHANSGFGPFTIYDNAKVANSKLIAYIKKINEQESRRDYFAGRSSRFFDNDEGDYYHSQQQQKQQKSTPQIQRRMLQYPGHTVYPPSSLYAKHDTTNKFNDETRMPVLEYAHPELGVQPAKSMPTDYDVQPKKIQYYATAKNVNADKFPYAIEPVMDGTNYYTGISMNDNGNKNAYDKYSMKNIATYPYNYGYLRKVKEQPFYMKFAEQMRDSFQNSFASVQEITRPVIDPLVEAGHKISKNLGFSSGQQHSSTDVAQDKSGVIASASTSTSIIPAIGLMAGGAALGLGAIAVGRIFDGNLLRRSNDDNVQADIDSSRAFDAIQNGENIYVIMEDNESDDSKLRRLRRSIDDFETFTENAGDQLIRVKRNRFNQNGIKFDGTTDFVEIYDTTGGDERSLPSSSDIDEIVQLTKEIENKNNYINRFQSDNLPHHRVHTRSIDEDIHLGKDIGDLLQDIEQKVDSSSNTGFEEQIRKTDWSNTQCAKKVFCDVMLQQTSDNTILMEKKMDALLLMYVYF